ncbi:hypothetical protein ONS96_007247 [Cadophora gregata f. sp. sojae]|nr:hypothetical protein ONS96_007247 [Cadophora gregata f. sp. sojae]
MKAENGVRAAVRSFHRNVPVPELNCDMVPKHPANWSWKKGKRTLKLSHRAASILVEYKKIKASSLKLHKSKPITIENRRWEPITATTSAGLDSAQNIFLAMSSVIEEPMQEYRRVKAIERAKSETASVYSSSSGGSHAAGAAGKAIGRGFGRVGMALTKTAIDLPMAMTDGMHNIPALYGEKMRDRGEISGWKSGGKVGLKSLGYGFYDGCVGFFTQPYKGARDGGTLGLIKGIAKGCGGLLTQPAHGIFPSIPS